MKQRLKPVTWCYHDRPPAHLAAKLLWCDKSTPVHTSRNDAAIQSIISYEQLPAGHTPDPIHPNSFS